MDPTRKRRLERAGWRVGSAYDLLGLSDEEREYIELKLSLAEELGRARKRAGLTQGELARKLGSSQSRVAKMEAADPGVAIDLLVRALLVLGSDRRAIARLIGAPRRTRAA